VNERFVPVWINIREEPIPDLGAIDAALQGIALDAGRRVSGGFSQSFFLRSLVLSPDGGTLMNPQDKPSLGHLFSQGYFPYAQVKPDDYLAMLDLSLRKAGSWRCAPWDTR
jgi:hypothetical protein